MKKKLKINKKTIAELSNPELIVGGERFTHHNCKTHEKYCPTGWKACASALTECS